MWKIFAVLSLITVTISLSNGFGIFDGLNINSIQPIKSNPNSEFNNKVSASFFDQMLDHFNPQNDETFKQKYYKFEEHYKPGGPIFIGLGIRGPLLDYILEEFLIDDIAREQNGSVFHLEHRFYGESTPNLNVSTANLRYLSVDQALADVAYFVDHIKSTYIPANMVGKTKIFVIGYEYGGGLAVWFRQKYPHLVNGAWASSAGVEARIDNAQFNEIVGDIYRKIGGNDCYHVIENAFEQMDQYIAENRSAELSEIFRTCNDIGRDQRNIYVNFAYLSQIFSQFIYLGIGLEPVSDVCQSLIQLSSSMSEMEALAKFHLTLLPEPNACYNADLNEIVATYQNEDPTSIIVYYGIRQAVYQQCSTLGWFATSNSNYQPFGTNVVPEALYAICEGVFGSIFSKENMNKNADLFNVFHGGLTPDVTKVIFTQGEMDPFRSLGIQRDINSETPTFIIPKQIIASDILKINLNTDIPEQVAVKLRIKDIFARWISDN